MQITNDTLIKPLGRFDVFVLQSPFILRLVEDIFYNESIIAGKGIAFIGFIFFLGYTLFVNYKYFIAAVSSSLMLFFAAFVLYSSLMEYLHDSSNWREINRTFFMMASVPLYASWILRNKDATRYIIFSFLFLTIVFALNIAFSVSLFTMLSFQDADSARDYASENLFFFMDMNGAGFFMGISLIICFLLSSQQSISKKEKTLYTIGSILFLYALLCCVSRSAFVNVLIVMVVMMIRYGIRIKLNHLLLLILFPLILSSAYIDQIDNLIFSRFKTIEIGNEGSGDSRVRLYSIALRYADDFFWTGVGEGNYYGEWGLNSDLAKEKYDSELGVTERIVAPAHNSFLQILLYWGIGAMLIYSLILVKIYTLLPSGKEDYVFSKCAVAMFLSTVILSLFTNCFNYKEFTLIYGLILGLYLHKKYDVTDNENKYRFT
jgi:hypothetical protein